MENYDIIICGAGCAGFCAAVAAARMGAKTALVEKYNTPGGILTVLGSNSIDQFNNPFIPEKKMSLRESAGNSSCACRKRDMPIFRI